MLQQRGHLVAMTGDVRIYLNAYTTASCVSDHSIVRFIRVLMMLQV